MTLNLRVLAPDQSVFDGIADEVILPSISGQVGILTGHVSMLTALDVGVMRLRTGKDWTSIALMGGFAEVEANEVTVLVNGAELGSSIDPSKAEQEVEMAEQMAAGFEGQPPSTEKVKAQQKLARSRARLQATRAN
ncbi:F0F1 ATP synthase subunit epsilon [Synechococcus sp. Cruz-9H2]|jgi:F-type H+-transporting ATPase subunit epsilon|uniref:ATP synthase F1 subunit epsilon n=1 Tax=unclassified Synechococcus TaxID=2626047 RepID=UPI0020CC5A7A|nr:MULTISPECIES: ATP synthase F1 subunit epsilon [unclassified Synechococcus]MCP9819123.1 F0F1 ATP synthase subunit epsilon [Synechococcus sp. Cruz-9H2]MCP9843627.1 F0F1 ATP synthase subunit epsilon [Synechococcus sp. Edmonson 11F2]MCP9855654.1 F0F1 ATP synthase subunit epsilon [Synechococcus sp. Cruz-9C9]MCP9863092.1 F0F1 ATP synthase subunit epsilon [Synechococcus sp. Cruz-7E5]MCP9870033.1 F0F1 ATP synthase subunit epsilon [Synechococcus sp. Cruz-7B9]